MEEYKNFDLTQYNSYKIKANCSVAYFPETESDIVGLYIKKDSYVFLGNGFNIILSKPFYDAEFIILNGNFNKFSLFDANCIEAEAGATMLDLSRFALENGLSGLEMFYDIPGSLGGAVVMNAGASGEEIKDVLLKVRYLDLNDLQVKEIDKADMELEYRNSIFQKKRDKIVLKAWLKLVANNKSDILEKMELIKAQRHAKQPKEYPNAGSVFKRPRGYFVGAIIDDLGLKGFSVGGAKISEKHSGFIINYNNATGADILNLIHEVKIQVNKKYGITLEVEQRII